MVWGALLALTAIFSAPATSPQAALSSQCFETKGTVQQVTYSSAITGREMVYSLYTPPCYAHDTTRFYPAVYLLHGSNAEDNHWLRLGLKPYLDRAIMQGEMPPLVVVMPFGAWLANENWFEGRVTWENVFLTELMPHVESNTRIIATRTTRAIGGISRGGFWAYSIGMRHPELFGAVGGHSAFFDPEHRPEAYNPLYLAADAEGLAEMRFWLDRGGADYAWMYFDQMHDALLRAGVPHTYTVHPAGEHNNLYWTRYLPDYMQFYAADWLDDARLMRPPPSALLDTAPPPTLANPDSGREYALFVPVVAFASPEVSLCCYNTLTDIAGGELVPGLVVDTLTRDALEAFGVVLHPETPVVSPVALLETLWQDRERFALLPFDRLTPEYRVLWVSEIHPLDLTPEIYPFAFESDSPNFHAERLTRVQFSGVTALTRHTRTAITQNGIEWATALIAPFVRQADFFHISNEVSFVPTCPNAEQPVLGGLCAQSDHAGILFDLGVDIVELSGNHNNDYGFDAYRNTLDFYRRNGLMTVGGGETIDEARRPLVLDHNGNTVALVACNWAGPDFALVSETQPGAAYCDETWLSEALPQLAAQYDVLVVLLQYSEYDRFTPTERQMADFRRVAAWGADVVLGSQAHQPQTFEFYTHDGGQTFIHYGLGNFLFDQTDLPKMQFFLDRLLVYEGRVMGIDLFAGQIDDRARPRPMASEARRAFLLQMFEYSGW